MERSAGYKTTQAHKLRAKADFLERKSKIMKLSENARAVLSTIGTGRVLAVALDGSHAKLLPVPRRNHSRQEYDVPMEIANEAIESGQLRQMTEDGEPPIAERKRGEGYRMGWRKLQVPGEGYRIYCCVQ